MSKKTLGLQTALGMVNGRTTQPLSASLSPVAETFPGAAPKEARQYKDRPAGKKPFMVTIDEALYEQLDALRYHSKRSFVDLSSEAFNDLLEKYRAR